ncbi:MAG: hypothetical protein ABI770_00775 [Sphingomicrobium sp.]
MAKQSDNPSPGALRNRRYRARIARHEAMGRFVITEALISALVRNGDITDAAARTPCDIEHGVAQFLARHCGT